MDMFGVCNHCILGSIFYCKEMSMTLTNVLAMLFIIGVGISGLYGTRKED